MWWVGWWAGGRGEVARRGRGELALGKLERCCSKDRRRMHGGRG